jgi:hypothetical protein
LDDHERCEAEDRVPPGVCYHYVIPTWQSFILGNVEKELYKTLEQRSANVVDILSSADTLKNEMYFSWASISLRTAVQRNRTFHVLGVGL